MNEIKKLNAHVNTRLLQMFRFVIGTFHSVDVVSPRAELYFFFVIYENTGLCEAERMRVTFTSEAFTEAA